MEDLLQRIRKNCNNKALIRGWFVPLAVYAAVLMVSLGVVLLIECFGVQMYPILCAAFVLSGITSLYLRISALRKRKQLSPDE